MRFNRRFRSLPSSPSPQAQLFRFGCVEYGGRIGHPGEAPALDQSNFAVMLAESGMQVPKEQLPSLFEGYQRMLRLIDLLGRPATLDSEPAVIFAPVKR